MRLILRERATPLQQQRVQPRVVGIDAAVVGRQQGGDLAHDLVRLRRQPGVAAGFGPVSYTHLRAHETVLDLVCRLLLENTKTTAQHTSCT